MRVPKIILTRPKIVVDVKCPKCKSLDIVATPTIDCMCKNCKTPITTDAPVNIYSSVAKKLNQLLGKNNIVWVVAERDRSTDFSADELLKPKSKQEDDYFHTLLAIKNNFEDMRNWEVSEITVEKDLDYKIHCTQCGYCHNCVTCTKCSKKYAPKKVGTKSRMVCPECKHRSYFNTFFPNAILQNGKKVCPYCGSDRITHTSFTSTHTKCPKCSSIEITKPREIEVYKLEIKRQPRFWIEDENSGGNN